MTEEELALRNYETRQERARLDRAVQELEKLAGDYSADGAEKWVRTYGYEVLEWLRERQEKPMVFHTMEAYEPPKEEPAQEVSYLDMMRAGASYGMMSAWDMARASGNPWTK